MSLRRVFILLGKEVLHGSKNFIFVFALVIPIVLTLIISLLFGTLFSGKPKLGINDQGNSKLASMLITTDALLSKEFRTDTDLRQAVESGAVDLGLVIPENFDTELTIGMETQLSAYIWGESLLKKPRCGSHQPVSFGTRDDRSKGTNRDYFSCSWGWGDHSMGRTSLSFYHIDGNHPRRDDGAGYLISG